MIHRPSGRGGTNPDQPHSDPRPETADLAWQLVGRRVQVRRARLGRQQSQVAGISRATLSRLEMGRPVSISTLARVEGELGFQEHELVSEVFGDLAYATGAPSAQSA